MPSPFTESLGRGIHLIDAQYMRPGLVSFYLLQGGDEYAVIDTGTVHSVPTLEALLGALGVDPGQVRYVIPTHVHLDHAGGAGLMMQRFPRAELLIHPVGARHLIDPSRLEAGSRQVYGDETFDALYGHIVPVDEARAVEVADGDCFTVGDRTLLFRHTAGHADHHFCVWDEDSRGWFTGDMFGICYRGFRTPGGDFCMLSTTPTQFRPEAMSASLELLCRQQPERMFLNHFGELAYSPQKLAQLQAQVVAYAQFARDHNGKAAAIESAIVDYCMDRVAAMNPGEDMSSMAEQFRFDADLNAQGLAVWMQRQLR